VVTLEDFQFIIENRVVPVLKAMHSNQRGQSKKNDAEFYPGYKANVRQWKDNCVHGNAKFPEKLFKSIAPNQNDQEYEYLKNTYEPVTESVFLEFSNTVKRSLINGNVEWRKVDNTVVDEFKEYITYDLPGYVSIHQFMSSLVDEKLMDANAVLGVHFEAEYDEEDRVQGRLKPIPEIYHCDRVVYFDDYLYIVERFEKSYVTSGGDMVKAGYKYLGFSKENYFYAEQYGDQKEYLFNYTEFEHEIGMIPATRLMGLPRIVENKLHFRSPFNISVPPLNLAALDNANLLIIKRKVGFPTRVMVAQKCRNQKNGVSCDNGLIRWSDGDERHEEVCGVCHGSGLVGVISPNSELLIEVNENPDQTQLKASEVLHYASPPVETPEFLRREIDKYITEAEKVLHLKAEPRQSGDITATEKNIDFSHTEAFIKPISDQIWKIYQYLIEVMGTLYMGPEFEEYKPDVFAPDDFNVMTVDDYIAQLAVAKNNGLPNIIIQQILYNMMMSMNYTASQTHDIFELIQRADRLWASSSENVALQLSRNTVQRWEAVLHESSLSLILELINENENFLDQEVEVQVEQLREKARSVVPESTVELPPPAEI